MTTSRRARRLKLIKLLWVIRAALATRPRRAA